MTTNDSRRLSAHKECAELPAHDEEKLLEAYTQPAAAAAKEDIDPVFVNSRRGNVPGVMKWSMALMLVLAVASAIAVIFGMNHHSAQSQEAAMTYATPGGNFVLHGGYAPQFVSMNDANAYESAAGELNAYNNAYYQPQASTEMTATATSADGTTQMVAVADPTTRVVYLFEVDSSTIPENATLNDLAKNAAMRGNDVTVVAYTDPTGSVSHNQALSKRRAKALGDYLTNHGVDPRHVKTVGKGVTDAFGSNNLDRRAELRF